jgi:hypothetical protein
MNSMPADSRAVLMAAKFAAVLLGTPCSISIRFIVRMLTCDCADSCSTVQRSAVRADRIWLPVIIDKASFWL